MQQEGGEVKDEPQRMCIVTKGRSHVLDLAKDPLGVIPQSHGANGRASYDTVLPSRLQVLNVRVADPAKGGWRQVPA